MIQICHVITDLDVAGAETMLTRLAKGMDPSRFEVSVVSLIEPGPLAHELRLAGVKVDCLNAARGRPSLRAAARMIALLRRDRPRIVQTWLYHADLLGFIGALFARTSNLLGTSAAPTCGRVRRLGCSTNSWVCSRGCRATQRQLSPIPRQASLRTKDLDTGPAGGSIFRTVSIPNGSGRARRNGRPFAMRLA